MTDKRCTFKRGQWNCGSYQFNLYKDDIDQGDLCDVHYWQTKSQREWVGLTDEDRKAALLAAYKEWECEELLLCAREDYLLIEQALKEKNT
jgi:hypothetical protein